MLELTFASELYDRIAPMLDGTVRTEGLAIRHHRLGHGPLFRRMATTKDYPVAEMSFSTYLSLRSRGDHSLIAIPVFPSRLFRHGYVFVQSGSDTRRMDDLSGRTVGTMQYQLTSNLWLRGILSDEHDIQPSHLRWRIGGQESPGAGERSPIDIPSDVEIDPIPEGTTLCELLLEGDIEAILAPHTPRCFEERPDMVRRLLPDYRQVEADYHRRTGFFPIMHVIVIRSDIYDANPWVARSLFRAFAEAKHIAFDRLSFSGSAAAMVPWLHDDVEQLARVFTGHYWPYGIDANRAELETMLRYASEQHITDGSLSIRDLFASETMDLVCQD